MTPNVELFEAACARVYTSGKRIRPIAPTIVNTRPTMIKKPMKILKIIVNFNDRSFLYKFREGDRADERNNSDQQDDFREENGVDQNGY